MDHNRHRTRKPEIIKRIAATDEAVDWDTLTRQADDTVRVARQMLEWAEAHKASVRRMREQASKN